jgi:hypothetical protein
MEWHMVDRVIFSFSEVDAVLASLNFIAEHKRAAFTARTKQLLKNDFLAAAGAGRGRAAAYSPLDLLQFAFAVELLQVGLPPSTAAFITKQNRLRLNQALIREISELRADHDKVKQFEKEWSLDYDTDLYMLLIPEALRELVADGDRTSSAYILLEPARLFSRQSFRQVHSYKNAGWRQLVINISQVIRGLIGRACVRFKLVSVDALLTSAALNEAEVLAAVQRSLERRLVDLDDEQLLSLSGVGHDEALVDFGNVPSCAVTVIEWREFAKGKNLIQKGIAKKIVKAIRESDNAAIVNFARECDVDGLFRIEGRELRFTRLGLGALDAAGAYLPPRYDDHEEEDDVSSEA